MIFWLAGCAPPTPPERPDVVLVTLDTTRADRLGSYGYADAHTPALDALAARGRRYARAYSPLPLTIPAHATLHTGRSPASLGIRSNGAGRLGPRQVTLAAHLRRHGWATGASVGAFVTSRTWGFDNGFDSFADDLPEEADPWHVERPAAAVVDDALAWWGVTEGPRFLWVHLYDPHFPYQPADPEVLRWTGGRPYDGELAYTDREVGRLLDTVGEQALVVVVGDHGEGLAEHGELTHGLFVYESTQRVPWLMAGPGVPNDVVESPVALQDVTPTILEALALPALPDAEGRAVPAATPRPVFVESWQLDHRYGLAPHLGIVDGPLKLIGTPTPELYDVVADPGETENLATARPDDVARLQALIETLPAPSTDPAHPLEPDERARLAALGYLDGPVVSTEGPRPDPKDRESLLAGAQRVERALLLHDWAAAESELVTLCAEHPEVVEFSSLRATVLGRLGRADEAAPLVVEALERDPENAALMMARGNLLLREGRAEEAAALLVSSAEALSFLPRLRARAVAVLVEVGRVDEALARGQEWLGAFPDDASLAGVVGVQLVRQGQVDEALPLLERGLLSEPPAPEVAYHLAAARLGSGDRLAAVTLLGRELDAYPDNGAALLALARLLAPEGSWERIAKRAESALEVSDGPTARHLAGQARFSLGELEQARLHVEAGLALSPRHAELLLLDANVLHAEGKPAEAEARFAEAKSARTGGRSSD